MDELTILRGVLERIVFRSEESGFSIVRIKASAKDLVTVRGYFPSIHEGEQVTLKGSWTNHPKFGRQFDAKECIAQLPSNVEGIRKYLASGLIKGIGPTFAKKLVDRFGSQTLEIIDQQPRKILEVGGIGTGRLTAIIEAWQTQKEISKVMVFLQEKGISTDFSVKIFKTYGHESIAKITENPYRLSDDIWGVGFARADKVALQLGFKPDSLYRIQSGILHLLGDAISHGHLYGELEETKEKALILLGLEEHENKVGLLKRAFVELFEQDKIKLLSHEDVHYVSLPQYYASEKGIAAKLKTLFEAPVSTEHLDLTAIYKQLRLPDSKGMALNEDQQAGILSCLQHKVTIITGGPGTGKTTLIRRMLEALDANFMRYRLAAPTGRAAKRMFEGTGKKSETLHRLLEFSPGTMGFTRNEQNAIDCDFLIVDEASMIDVFLMHAIVRALPQKAHLVLIGDIDQLPSVGAGNILNDLIASGVIAVTRLLQIFRQAQDSMIVVNAHRINTGEFPTSSQPGSRNDYVYIKEDVPEKVFEHLRDIYEKRLKRFGIAPKDSVVLTPMNKGLVGTQRLNQELQSILNPKNDEDKQVGRFGQIYKVDDRVMQIKNNYDKFVFNGDMGTIMAIDREDQKLLIRFGERDLSYDFSELNELVLSYAISIHKSQGSEFRAVIVPLFMQHFIMLQRNLIYTAITRAKELCIFIGQPRAIAMGIKNNKGVVRKTFLKEFLTTDLEAR